MPDKVTISINGQRWGEWNRATVKRNIDSVSTITLECPWDPEREDMREAFRPYSYHLLECWVEADKIFTGYLLTPDPSVSPKEASISVTGYGKPGVLMDCTMPPDSFPLEINGLTVDQIARKLCEPFGIGVTVRASDLGAPIAKADMKPNDSPFSKLAEWCKQRNLLLSDTPDGDLLILQPDPNQSPVESLEIGQPPLQSIKSKFDGQTNYSTVTAISNTKIGSKGGKNTIPNPTANGAFRPLVFEADKSDYGDLPKAAQGKLARILGAIASWEINTPAERTSGGLLWQCGQIVSVLAAHVMIYRRTPLLISSVSLSITPQSSQTSMDLVIKESFSDTAPEGTPWD